MGTASSWPELTCLQKFLQGQLRPTSDLSAPTHPQFRVWGPVPSPSPEFPPALVGGDSCGSQEDRGEPLMGVLVQPLGEGDCGALGAAPEALLWAAEPTSQPPLRLQRAWGWGGGTLRPGEPTEGLSDSPPRPSHPRSQGEGPSVQGPRGLPAADKGRAGEEQRARADRTPVTAWVEGAVPGFPQCFGAKLFLHPTNPPDLSTCKLYPQARRGPPVQGAQPQAGGSPTLRMG